MSNRHSPGDPGFSAWPESLDAEQLLGYRFELYDRLEAADEDSEAYAFARSALTVVYALERRHAVRRWLCDLCQVAAPDVDGEAFADAAFALTRARRELGGELDIDVLAGALEVAERRAVLAGSSEKENG